MYTSDIDFSLENLFKEHYSVFQEELLGDSKDVFSSWVSCIKDSPPGVCVEVGSLFGFSTFVFAWAALGCGKRVLSIDAYPTKGANGIYDYDNKLQLGLDNFKKYVLDRFPNVTQLNDDISNCIDKLPDEICFCYIDSLHTYKQVMKEFSIIYPRLVPGGWVVFDDVGWYDDQPESGEPNQGGVSRAVSEIVVSYPFSERKETNQKLWLRK